MLYDNNNGNCYFKRIAWKEKTSDKSKALFQIAKSVVKIGQKQTVLFSAKENTIELTV